jgi:hypothetical protein
VNGTLPRRRKPPRANNNREVVALLRGEVDAIFLKGAHGAQVAHQFGLTTVIDTGAHPEPLIRANNGTPRTLAVDGHLLDNHFDAAVTIVEQVLRAESLGTGPCLGRAPLSRARDQCERILGVGRLWQRRADQARPISPSSR